MAAGGALHTRRRWGLRLATVISVLCAGIVALPAQSGTERPVVPTQWIAKQYSELLGRSPTGPEWNASVASFEATSRCSAGSLADMGRDLAGSDEFAASYPEQTPLDKAQRFTSVIRATLSRDPNLNDWNEFFAPYREGDDSWSQVLDPSSLNGGYNWEVSRTPDFSDLALRNSTAPSITQAPVSGASSDGLTTTAFPAATAAIVCVNGIPNGKFHGVITATTP